MSRPVDPSGRVILSRHTMRTFFFRSLCEILLLSITLLKQLAVAQYVMASV